MGNFFDDVGEFFGLSAPDGPPTTGQDGHQGSPWDPNVQWAGGMPDRAPGRHNPYRYAWQYEADRQTELYRRQLYSDSRGAFRQGIGVMESYRPGGSAALAGGMYHGMAQSYGQQAAGLRSPDVMMNIRDEAQVQANREAQRAAGFGRLLGLASTVAGFVAGGPAGGALAASASGLANPGASGAQQGQSAGTGPGGQQLTQLGPGVGNTGQVSGQELLGNINGGGVVPPPPAGIAAPATGGVGGGGGGGEQNRFGGAPAPGGVAGAPPGGPVGGNLFPQGGLGTDGNFSPTAGASSAMRAASPVVETSVTNSWANSKSRQRSGLLMSSTARKRLLEAQAGYDMWGDVLNGMLPAGGGLF